MLILSILFFISSFLSAVVAVLVFLGLIPGNGKKSVAAAAISSAIFAALEIICILDPPFAEALLICGVILVSVLLFLSGKKEENAD